MRTTIRIIMAACSGAMLLACGSAGLNPEARPPQAAQSPPQGADEYYARGRDQHGAQRYAEAMQAYRQALQLDPHHVNARNGLAVLYAGQGDYRQAIALWQSLVRERGERADPEGAYLLGNLGFAYFLAGDHEHALAALEQACVRNPLNPLSWEHLSLVLDKLGLSERAALMLKQARTLQAHDLRRDYALLPAAHAEPGQGAAGARAWPSSMARTEIVPAGAAMVQVTRVAAVSPADASPAGSAAELRKVPARLEISNGNGVTGMAAGTARTLRGRDFQVVRLSNVRDFGVTRSRIEYQQDQQATARALAARLGMTELAPKAKCGYAELRLVLGYDRRPAFRPRP